MRAARSASPSTAAASPRRRRLSFRRRAGRHPCVRRPGGAGGAGASFGQDLRPGRLPRGAAVGGDDAGRRPGRAGPADGGGRGRGARCPRAARARRGPSAAATSRTGSCASGPTTSGRQARGDDLQAVRARSSRRACSPQRGSRRDQCSARASRTGPSRRRHRQLSALWFVEEPAGVRCHLRSRGLRH